MIMTKMSGTGWLIAAAMVCSNLAMGTPHKPEEDLPAKEKWISLFNGKSTKGWHGFNADTVGSAWKVTDGVLWLDANHKKSLNGKGGGDIATDEVFDQFHLKLEWKISKNGNSGIMWFVQEEKKYKYPWETGPEMQVIDNDGHPDARNIKHRAGDLYDLIACSQETVKPLGEWNLAEVIFQNNKLELRLNGVTVVTTTVADQSWTTMIAGSKFKGMPDFGKFTKGKIALQDHGDDVWFRNIQIRKL
jgi:hypothetical protein